MPFATSRTTRTVTGSPATVRAVVVRALREQHFEITAEQVTVVEARRGSSLGAAALLSDAHAAGRAALFAIWWPGECFPRLLCR